MFKRMSWNVICKWGAVRGADGAIPNAFKHCTCSSREELPCPQETLTDSQKRQTYDWVTLVCFRVIDHVILLF